MSSPRSPGIDAVLALARPELLTLPTIDLPAWESGWVRLSANELPWPPAVRSEAPPLNRYPEPQPRELLRRMAAYYGVAAEQVLVGRGSDELIDLLTRAFCRAAVDAVVTATPTFDMYALAAGLQGAGVREVPLQADLDFAFPTSAVCAAIDGTVRIVWLCSPNNPTGCAMPADAIASVLDAARDRALVVVDEAYAEFSTSPSAVRWLDRNPHLAILRTLSKAHGLAGARIGALLAAPELVDLLRRIIAPYAVPSPSAAAAVAALAPEALAVTRERAAALVLARDRLAAELRRAPDVRHVYPSDANFLLVRCRDAALVVERARAGRLLLRSYGRSGDAVLRDCVRVTIGSDEENARVVAVFRGDSEVRA